MAITVVETKTYEGGPFSGVDTILTLDNAPEENDFLVAWIVGVTATSGDFTANTGGAWSTGTAAAGAQAENRLFYRRAGDSEGAAFEFSKTGGITQWVIVFSVLRGVAVVDGVEAVSVENSLTTANPTVVDASFALAAFGTGGNFTCGSADLVVPSGWTLAGSACRPNVFPSAGPRGSVIFRDAISAGPLGAVTGEWVDAGTPLSSVVSVLLTFVAAEVPPPVPPGPGGPGGPSLQSPLDRYRSSISADAGSLLATTRAVPFDTSHTIAFSPAAELEQENLYPFYEAASVQSGQPDVVFYPRARQSIDGPVVYDGVTILTLMERVFPAQILRRTASIPLSDPDGATLVGADAIRPQVLITYVFEQWAAQFPWFTYKPVPDLRLRNVAVTDDWDSVLALKTTVLWDTVIRVLQSPESPRSMLAMLESLLSPFPGTQYFMDSDGDLVIRPVYGPDADDEPFRELDGSDVVTASIGEPSVDNIINRSTVSHRQYTQSPEVSVLTPAFLQVTSGYMRFPGFLPGPPADPYLVAPPGDRLNISIPTGGLAGWRSIPLGEGIVLGDSAIALEDADGPLITAAVNTYNSAGALQEAWTSPGDLTIDIFNEIPLSGATVLAFGVRRGAGYTTNSYHGQWNARWNASTNAVEVQWAGGSLEVNTALAATLRVAAMQVTINGVSTAWAEGATISATFGVVGDGDFVPGPEGTNALEASVTAFGVLEERFTIEGYGALDADTLLQVAQARVIQNLTPRATRELALGGKGSVALVFDDRGRMVGIPDGGEGFLTGVRYTDDFIAVAGGKTITVEETVPGSPGTIDFDALYLLLDDGSVWLNDDLSPSLPA